MSEWISVDDRLPEKGQRVLAFDPDLANGFVDIASMVPDKNILIWAFIDDIESWWVALANITHWMPLPNPPISQMEHNQKAVDFLDRHMEESDE